jgi:hypothetical protein
MALGENQIFEALVSPDSAVEWHVTHNPSPDIFPTPGVRVVEIVSENFFAILDVRIGDSGACRANA